MAAAGEHELELGPLLAEERERLEQPRVVLVRPGPRGVEEELLALVLARAEALVVEAPRDRVHALRLEAEELDRPPAHELARHDHDVRVARRALVHARAEHPLGAREELGVVEVLEVVHGHGRGEVELGIATVSG